MKERDYAACARQKIFEQIPYARAAVFVCCVEWRSLVAAPGLGPVRSPGSGAGLSRQTNAARSSQASISWLDLSWKSHTALRCLPTTLPQLADFGEVARCCLHRLSLVHPSDLRCQANAA